MRFTDEQFARIVLDNGHDVKLIMKQLKKESKGYKPRRHRVIGRIERLRKTGLLPLDSGNYVSVGEILKGTSTLYDSDCNIKAQWVKTNAKLQDQLDQFKEIIESLSVTLPKFEPTPATTSYTSSNLMSVYPIGDPHVGMLAYKEEAGDDWNLEKAQKAFCGVFDRLIKSTPQCDKAVIVNLGDFFHRDNVAGVTERHRHVLDTDGNYLMMVETGIKIMIQMINSALQHHTKVEVINTLGNHDDTGAMFLQAALKQMYLNEPRVQINCTSSVFQYFEFGNSFFGVHHGHTCKADKLPLVMATDKPEEWGRAKHRSWLCGHVHHDTVREFSGCTVETFRTIIAKDAYAAAGGYRAKRDSKALVIHEEYGEIERHTVNIDQVLGK